MAQLTHDITYNFYIKDASQDYNEEMECLMVYSDHCDKVVFDGIDLTAMKELFARIGPNKLKQTKKEKEAS
jgi:hypothetical protein